jgi:hypothetical protein
MPRTTMPLARSHLRVDPASLGAGWRTDARSGNAYTEDSMSAERIPLSEIATFILDECRMVLPGIQALFGFQLIAVFNQGFQELERGQQLIHLAALGLVAIAVAIVMTPAAYHRQAEQHSVSERFVTLGSRLLLLSMFPLMSGICLDFYVIAMRVLHRQLVAAVLAGMLFVIFSVLWFLLPRMRMARRTSRAQ